MAKDEEKKRPTVSGADGMQMKDRPLYREATEFINKLTEKSKEPNPETGELPAPEKVTQKMLAYLIFQIASLRDEASLYSSFLANS